jgi:hypothetical protein
MKNIVRGLCAFTVTSMLIFGCQSSSMTDDFEDANGGGNNVQRKLIENFTITSANNSEENQNIQIAYTTDGKLNTISNGSGVSIFVYDNAGNLETITGSGNSSGINLAQDVYQSPYEVSEAQVLEYDSNGNPFRILFYQEEYDYTTWSYVTREYIATVTYDNAPNPFFHTLEAGGIIDALQQSQVNFTAVPQSAELVQASLLLPFNNPSQIIYRDENDEIVYTINGNYTYDSDNYPTSATISASGNSDSNVYSISYTYAD